MLPWMNKAYAAKKQRIPDALHLLLNEDEKGAREALRTGGIGLTEDLDARSAGWFIGITGD